MSLLSEAMEDCCYIDKTTQADGYGGVETVWKVGADFKAAISYDSSNLATIAAKDESVGQYRITTEKGITLMHNDVVKRKSDGKIFLVTTDGTDNKTPKSAALNMRVVKAKEWELVDG